MDPVTSTIGAHAILSSFGRSNEGSNNFNDWLESGANPQYTSRNMSQEDAQKYWENNGGEGRIPSSVVESNGRVYYDDLADAIRGLSGKAPEMPESEASGTAGKGISAADKYYDTMSEWAREQQRRSRELWNTYKNEYLPGEVAWARQTFAGIPIQQEVNWATNDVNAAYDRAQNIQARNMQSMGINPNSPAYHANQAQVSAARAAAEAGARTTARRKINDVNWNRRLEAVNAGRNLLGPSTGMASLAASMETSGHAGYQGALANQMQMQNAQEQRAWQSGEAAAQRGWQSNENRLNREYQQQMADQQAEAQMWSGLMSMGGMAAGALIGGPVGASIGGSFGNMFGNRTSSYNPGTSFSGNMNSTDTAQFAESDWNSFG